MESLWIAGAGDLGWRVARQLYRKNLRMVLETATPKRHPQYAILGAMLKTREETKEHHKPCSNLLISFPPRENYEQAVSEALKQWTKEGTGVLVSSTGVYLENEGALVNEHSATRESSMTRAENLALAEGCHVVRLAGLYSLHSGPHLYWQARGEAIESSQALLNLIHRHDAAVALSALLESNLAARIWNLSDGQALTRESVARTWMEAQGLAVLQTKSDSEKGKLVQPDSAWASLGWQPRWQSFVDFVDSLRHPRNVFGSPLKTCSLQPLTGFSRDGCCHRTFEDRGEHSICCEMTESFLSFSKAQGNDLSTPRLEFQFPGLKEGDRWCVCAARWFEAWLHGQAPRIYLESSHESLLEWAPFKTLGSYALDLS